MEKNELNSIINNFDISVITFPAEKNGNVEFKVLNKINTTAKNISFSAVVDITYNSLIKNKLELSLVKMNNSKNDDKIAVFKLTDIEMDLKEEDLITKDYELKLFKNIDEKEYHYRKTFRYTFENIPLLGTGLYYLAVLVPDNEKVISLKSTPIVIKDTKTK